MVVCMLYVDASKVTEELLLELKLLECDRVAPAEAIWNRLTVNTAALAAYPSLYSRYFDLGELARPLQMIL